MKNYGRTSISEFLGDFIVYRNLVPVDSRLPALPEIGKAIGLARGIIPRKIDEAYGSVVVELLKKARSFDEANSEIKKLVYLGDTTMTDVTAFVNICRVGGYQGIAFIGAENGEPPHMKELQQNGCTICYANRWALLKEFDALCRRKDFLPNTNTAVVADIDKTILGARGRNDLVIDRVRIDAAERVIHEKMSDRFNHHSFQKAYDTLKRQEYHSFTSDNQDYLVYICLAVGSGVLSLDSLLGQIKSGTVKSFNEFIESVESRVAALPADMRAIHNNVYECVRDNDLTPFKVFRLNEFKLTAERMGCLDDAVPPDEMLKKEIVLTEEVRDFILSWKLQGTVVFGLSDKTDEASLPTGDVSVRGFQPIHHIMTHAIGEYE